jgi:hypothetical protein
MSSGREHAASTYVSCLAGQAPCHCRKSRTAAHALQTRTTPNTFTPRESAHSAPGPAPDRGRLGGVPVYRRLNLSKGFTASAGKRAGGSMAGNAPTPEQESRGLRRHASAHSASCFQFATHAPRISPRKSAVAEFAHVKRRIRSQKRNLSRGQERDSRRVATPQEGVCTVPHRHRFLEAHGRLTRTSGAKRHEGP